MLAALLIALVALICRGLTQSTLSTHVIRSTASVVPRFSNNSMSADLGGNSTGLIRRHANDACDGHLDTKWGKKCYCYDDDPSNGDRPGIRHETMDAALSEACAEWMKWTWGKGGQKLAMNHPFPYDLGSKIFRSGNGLIWTRMEVTRPDDPKCKGPMWIKERWCKHHMFRIVDDCDLDGENDKHGGESHNDCFRWWLDPRPADGDFKNSHPGPAPLHWD